MYQGINYLDGLQILIVVVFAIVLIILPDIVKSIRITLRKRKDEN